MGLSGFRNNGDYIKIDALSFNKPSNEIFARLGYYSERGGALLMPMDINISRNSAIHDRIKTETANLEMPVYPSICAERDAMIPTWSEESTEAEKEDYESAKAAYLAELSEYNISLEAIKANAETDNDFDTYFSATTMYGDGNIEKCVYTWVKTLDMFSGTTDVLENE